jgi:hypothetical protein
MVGQLLLTHRKLDAKNANIGSILSVGRKVFTYIYRYHYMNYTMVFFRLLPFLFLYISNNLSRDHLFQSGRTLITHIKETDILGTAFTHT